MRIPARMAAEVIKTFIASVAHRSVGRLPVGVTWPVAVLPQVYPGYITDVHEYESKSAIVLKPEWYNQRELRKKYKY